MVQCSKSNNKVPRPYPYVILSVSEISHDLSTEKLPQKNRPNKEKNGCL